MNTTENTAADVVVIGGGVQGLIILDKLIEAGYSSALVTEGDVGAGQTLHSHGYLNTGFGMFGDELPRAAAEIVHPYLRARGVELNDNWAVIPPPDFPASTCLPSVELPAGFSPGFSQAARKLPDQSFSKRQLVEALMRGHTDRIIRGTVLDIRGREPVEAVRVRLSSSRTSLELRARAVVVAAGCGSKRLLRGLVGPTPQIEEIKHRLVHMVCLRAARGALPATSVVALPLGLLLAAHDDSRNVTWYVTPMEMSGPSFDDVPNDASAGPLPEKLARACRALLTLYPALPDTEGLQVGHYAGYRQDIGDAPAARMCELIAGTSNVIATLPSGLVAPWLNAADAIQLVGRLADPSGAQPRLPGRGEGVRPGRVVEDRPDFKWMTWEEWRRPLSHLLPAA
jgi:glycine/D-amino acid oxidase-like deaminating enzyme